MQSGCSHRLQTAIQILQGHDQALLLRGPAGEARLAEAEVRLLVALASAKDQTLERWQVAVQLSPDNDDISPDNLQNRLSQLRKKIAACGMEGESLTAIRGSGYRLCVPVVVV
jgi:DNA-binding response OmpR family regulator